jgi:hypothetical protein
MPQRSTEPLLDCLFGVMLKRLPFNGTAEVSAKYNCRTSSVFEQYQYMLRSQSQSTYLNLVSICAAAAAAAAIDQLQMHLDAWCWSKKLGADGFSVAELPNLLRKMI